MDTNEQVLQKKSNFWLELGKLVILSIVIVIPFRLYIAQPFIVDGASMDPTFKNGQYLIVDELSYHFNDPDRGSVLIFRYPRDPSKYFIKRVIGLPGETVVINEGIVTIKNIENPDGTVLDEPYIKFTKQDNLEFTLKEDEFFVMGDNRLASADSRIWGAVPREDVVGRPIVRFYPFNFFPGKAVIKVNTQE